MKVKKVLIIYIIILITVTVATFTACSKDSKIDESRYRLLDPKRTWTVLMEMNDFPGEEGDLLVDFINSKRMKAALMRLGVEESHINLSQDDLSMQSVIKALDWMNENSKEGDTVVFYIMTHGGWLKNQVAWNTIFPERWRDLEGREQILIVDCCNSENYIYDFIDDEDIEISISSCAADEKSWVGLEREGLPVIGNVWTYYFTEAILNTEADKNKDRMITLEEAFSYTTLATQKYMAEEVYEVDEFLQMFLDVGGSIDEIGSSPNPVMYNHNSKELILYRIPE